MKVRLSIFVCIFLFLTLSCSRDWIQFRGNQGRGEAEQILYPPFGIKWKLKLQEGSSTSKSFNNPVLIGNSIYFGSIDGNFYAFNLDSGYMEWVFQTNASINSIPFADKKNVYFGSNDGSLYAVDRKKGELRWQFETESTVKSSVVGNNGLIVFSSDGGKTYFLDTDGNLQMELPNPVWHYHTFQIYKDIMYFAPGPIERPRSFAAFDINSKEYLWLIDTAKDFGAWYSFPALKGDKVLYSKCENIYPSWKLSYIVRDRFTGENIWEKSEEAFFDPNRIFNTAILLNDSIEMLDFLSPVVYGNTVIYASGDNAVRSFRIKDGSKAWTKFLEEPTSSAATLSGDRLYLGLRGEIYSPANRSPRLVCLSARDGRLLWELETEGAILGSPVIAGKWIIFCTEDQVFYVLEAI